jgi:hypothetical protein
LIPECIASSVLQPGLTYKSSFPILRSGRRIFQERRNHDEDDEQEDEVHEEERSSGEREK